MLNRCLVSIPADQHRRTLDLGQQVAGSSGDWLREYPIVRRDSVTAACSLASAVAMPSLAVPELTLLTCWWLWIFGVDDRFDDPAVPDAELTAWSMRFEQSLFREPRADAPDLLVAALDSIRRDLSRYPMYPRLAAAWHRGMVDVISGMLTERGWPAGLSVAEAPSYQTYLNNGIKTISVQPYTVTACVLADEPRAAAKFGHLGPLIRAAARCFRLANDLGSDARECKEGKLNAVSLLQRVLVARGLSPQYALRSARTRIRATCESDLEFLYEAQLAAPPPVRTLSRFLWAHTTFVCGLYEDSDYDGLSTVLSRGVAS